ncbi:ABC transporter ATP-binding protein [Persicimonas caeni]|uniref:ABC transporter ATP-binding protein n=1 Tax=Persicimonas caeni TaxID=2292766 RepID=A0A4Y6PVW3_PERCE|nr:ABC transporter ATP-binding protein [Persicimonas caeni]QDG52491.1 ABC transporter ATP-binding protein [Persicimonas caeni]QED33713.1 ABC transporter ATP-binding protein [Persicimonas caeni]
MSSTETANGAATAQTAQKTQQTRAERPIARVGGDPVVISARRLSLWYGQVIGVNDISLDIGPGVTGLLGPNGAGKSTLMKILSGQLRPSTGAARMFGEPIWNNSKIFSRVGLVPEQDAFYEEMTGKEFVTYLTRLQGYSPAEADKMADETIELVGMTESKDRPIEEYSKGMRQRIKLAQAISHDPDVLFLDEPLTGTDPVGRHKMIELVNHLGDEGKTVLVSSHVLHEVEQMTRDILLINKGRVLAEGNIYKIRELIDEHPHTIFIDCDAPRKFAAMLTEYDDIVRVEFTDKGFQVATRDPDSCYPRIPRLAREHGIELRGYMSPDNNLMSVFEYLVK